MKSNPFTLSSGKPIEGDHGANNPDVWIGRMHKSMHGPVEVRAHRGQLFVKAYAGEYQICIALPDLSEFVSPIGTGR